MVRSVHEGAKNNKIHIRYNILISGRLVFSNPLVPEVLDSTTCTVYSIYVNIFSFNCMCVMAGVIIDIFRLVYMSVSGCQFGKPPHSVKCM
jgi:hypothetical protein